MRNVYLLPVIALVILLSGCIGGDDIEMTTFVGGDEGIAVSFVGSNPPARVFQGRDFDVILKLENKGEHNIGAGDVRILFSNAQTFGVSEYIRYNTQDISKRIKAEVDYIPGGLDYIEFNDLSYKGPASITEDSPVSIAVDVCYPYETTAVADVCVSKETESSICDPLGEPEVQTSGGPILITKVNQLSSGQISTGEVLVDLKINFEVVGEGDIYHSSADCSNLSTSLIDELVIEKLTLGLEEFTGEPLKEVCNLGDDYSIGIKPDEQTATVTCIIPVQNVAEDYIERFTITASYVHSRLITKQISIMPVIDTMKKCIESADCEEGTYCEQPGFCRTKIGDSLPCGYPMGYDSAKDKTEEAKETKFSETCMSNICDITKDKPNGICQGVFVEQIDM